VADLRRQGVDVHHVWGHVQTVKGRAITQRAKAHERLALALVSPERRVTLQQFLDVGHLYSP